MSSAIAESGMNYSTLDAEYRQILFIIKPYIMHINDAQHIEQYKVWLERLNDAGVKEKYERNKYVVELANQIHDGVLKSPFTVMPPRGPLPKLTRYQVPKVVVSPSPQPITSKPKKKEGVYDWPFMPPKVSSFYKNEPEIAAPPSSSTTKADQLPTIPVKRRASKASKLLAPRPSRSTKIPVKTHPKSSKQSKKNKSIANSSWFDISETSSNITSEHSGTTDTADNARTARSESREQIEKPSVSIDKMKRTDSIKEQLSRFDINHFFAMEKSESNVVSGQLVEDEDDKEMANSAGKEVEALKMRMMDLVEVKNALKDTHCLTEDRKKTIESLQSKLIEVENQNRDLKALIDQQTKRIVEMDMRKSRELNEFKEKFIAARKKEVEKISQGHLDDLKAITKINNAEMLELKDDCQRQIDDARKVHEEEIKEIMRRHQETLQMKEEESLKVQAQLEAKIEESLNVDTDKAEQINHLKRCVSKLDKLLQKNEMEHVKTVEKLKQDLELKDMTMHVQLQTQKAGLIIRNNVQRQEEVKKALNQLEMQYIKMVEAIQTQAMENKLKDETKIQLLRATLDDYKIPYK